MPSPAVLETTPAEWRELAVGVIAQYAELGQPFTADQVRPHLSEPHHANAWGGAFQSARARGIIQRAGFTTSTQRSRRHSVQAVWIDGRRLF